MANSETIDQIISDKALAELDSATDKVALLAKQFNDLLPSVAALNAALGGNQSLAAFNRQLQQAAIAQQRLNTAQQQAVAATARAQQAQNNLANQIARTTQQQATATTRAQQATTAYGQLIERQKQLNEAARQAGAAFGIQSQQFQQASQQANAVNGEVAAINRSLGNYRDNVGNYASAFSKAFGTIRTIANILPGIGISGLFLAAYEAIKYVVSELGLFNASLSNTQRIANVFKDALAAPDYATAISNVSQLRENIELAKEGFLDKGKVLKEYNETIGKTTGQVNTLREAEDQLNKKADAYIKFTLLKSVATAALKDAADKAVESQKTMRQTDDDTLTFFDKLLTGYVKVSNFLSGPGAKTLVPSNFADNLLGSAKRAETITKAEKEQKSLLNIFKDFQKQAAELAKQNGFSFFGAEDKDDKQANNDALELLKQRLQNAKDAANRIFSDENNSYGDRLKALKDYENRSKEILRVETEIRLREAGLSSDKIKSIRLQEQNQIIEIQTEGTTKRAKLQADANKKALDDYKRLRDQLTDQEKQRLSDIQNAGNARLQELETQQTNAEAKLAEDYNNNKITYKKYQEDLKDIQEKASLARIDVSIGEAQNSIETLAAGLALGVGDPKQLQDATNKLVQLQNQRKQQVTKIKTDETKTAEELAKQARDIEIQTAQEALSAVSNIYQFIVKAKQDQLKKEEDLVDKQAQRDKDANNRSLKSARQRAQAEAEIDAQAAAQKEVIRQKDLELRRKAAIEEKVAAIASIIINTQIGVAKVIGQTGIFGIPLSAFLYAQEALQIAAVLAQPLPAYEKGTTFAKGGLSRVSEKGSELVIEPSGKSYLTPETESIIDLKRGSKVIPAHQVQAMMGRPERIQNIGGVNVDLSELTVEQRESNRLLKKIADKRTIIQQGNGKFMRYRNSYFGKN